MEPLLRPAPRPRGYAWTLPVGLCIGIGAYCLTFGQIPRTGLGFLFAGWLIYRVFGRLR